MAAFKLEVHAVCCILNWRAMLAGRNFSDYYKQMDETAKKRYNDKDSIKSG